MPLPVASPSPQKYLSWPLTLYISSALPVFDLSINRIIQYVLPCVWLLLLDIMFMSSYLYCCRQQLFISVHCWRVCQWMNKTQFIYPFCVYRYLNCSQLLRNVHIHKHDFLLAMYLLHIYLEVKLLTHWLCICSVLIYFAKGCLKLLY